MSKSVVDPATRLLTGDEHDALSRETPYRSAARGFRADIEGMRAIAIIVIVAYHAGLPGFSGGFIGVDVFFVISGYLITRNLLDESTENDSIRLPRFWARRIRRLVPGLALMVVVTLAVCSLVVVPFDMLQISKEGAAAALYFSNIVFGFDAQNYFAANINKSPFLHTWSLGVEEQFYLVWPFLLYGVLLLSRRAKTTVRRMALPILPFVLAASFALNLVWTNSGGGWAFFSLPSRAWEFAAGGLIASVHIRQTRYRWSVMIGLVGLFLIAYADVFFTDATPFPGANALWPVVGAVLLIVSGQMVDSAHPTVIGQALGIRPMQWTGRLSYSWYLWHWPFIVVVVLITGSSGAGIRTAAALASLVVAYLASMFVENPLRFSEALRRSSWRTYVVGLGITLVALATAGGTWVVASRSTPTSFTQAKNAAFKNFFPVCRMRTSPEGTQYCQGGDLSSPTVVALVGDSHAATWFNELSAVAVKQHVRLVGYMWPGCPFIPIVVRPLPGGPVNTRLCLGLRARGMRLLTELKPKAVVLSQHDGQYLGFILDKDGTVPSTRKQVELWSKAFATFLRQMQVQGIHPAVILDNPTLPYDPAECVSRTQSLAACEPSRQVALSPARAMVNADQSILKKSAPSVPAFSPDTVLCNQTGCPLELQGHLLYADTNHLLFGATQLMAPQLMTLLTSALVGR